MIFKFVFTCAFLAYASLVQAYPLENIFTWHSKPHEIQAQDLTADLSNWMTNLPTNLRQLSITKIAIPGSHDSFTAEMDSSSDVAPDAVEILKELEKVLGSLLKQVMANWSITQAYMAQGQLERGIRYFDLRVAPKNNTNQLFIVHGLYASEVLPILVDINTFLDSHPKEVVILDFQHLYSFEDSTHTQLIEMITSTFGSKLMPATADLASVTLDAMAEKGYQVIIIYREDSKLAANPTLWASSYFPNPWADTTDADTLINALNTGLQNRDKSIPYISQLVLTPSADYILKNLISNLKKKCAQDFEDARTQWITAQAPGDGGLNIVIADFIDLSDNQYVKDVINQNQKLVTKSLWKRFLGMFRYKC